MKVAAHWWWIDDPAKSWRFTLPNMMLEDIGIHHFDTIRMLLGNAKCTQVYCNSFRPKSYPLEHIIPSAMGILTFDNDVVVDYFGSMSVKGFHTSWDGTYEIFGEKGSLIKPDVGEPYATFEQTKNRLGLDTEFGENLDEFLPFPDFDRIAYLLEDFYHAITEDRPPVTDLHDNLNSHAILMAMKKSAAEHRAIDVQSEFPI
jgi:predicted dehydrogenase